MEELTGKGPACSSLPEKAGEGKDPLEVEHRALRGALRQARARMKRSDEDAGTARLGTLVARLTDALVRVQLARQRLAAGTEASAEWERMLREAGLGEESEG